MPKQTINCEYWDHTKCGMHCTYFGINCNDVCFKYYAPGVGKCPKDMTPEELNELFGFFAED
jgi:hypothetical protein